MPVVRVKRGKIMVDQHFFEFLPGGGSTLDGVFFNFEETIVDLSPRVKMRDYAPT